MYQIISNSLRDNMLHSQKFTKFLFSKTKISSQNLLKISIDRTICCFGWRKKNMLVMDTLRNSNRDELLLINSNCLLSIIIILKIFIFHIFGIIFNKVTWKSVTCFIILYYNLYCYIITWIIIKHIILFHVTFFWK